MGAEGRKVAAEQQGAKVGGTAAATIAVGGSPAIQRIFELQRAVGNRALGALLVAAQPKLTVGAADDPYEREADSIADEVVARLRSSAPPIESCEEGETRDRRSILSRLQRRASPSAELPEVGWTGGDLDSGAEAQIGSLRAGGSPLPTGVRRSMEGAFGADFGDVRIHRGVASAELNRKVGAEAFTVGKDIFLGAGTTSLECARSQHLLAHELTHTIQQDGATVSRTHEHVQRHSSFEHLMLGNLKPKDLATVGAWQDAIEQTKPTRTGLGKMILGSGGGKDEAQVDVKVGNQNLQIKKADILHVLLEEMLRLRDWQRTPPEKSSVEQGNPDDPSASMTPIGVDPEFQVYTVRLPQGLLCTYGEMNTLADYYGSVEVFKKAGKKEVYQLLQSVREETWGFLESTYNKVAESLTKQEREDPEMDEVREKVNKEFNIPALEGEDTGGSFKGATAFQISGMWGQIELIKGVQSIGVKKEEGKTNKYLTSLGRNACHFVPESWNAWADNHKKARALAAESFRLFRKSEATKKSIAAERDPEKKKGLEAQFMNEKDEASDKGNEALMVNGFGDHYLQDSFAAGHMINKTQIMQFYIEYIDEKNQWDYFKDANWRKVQNIAYNQILAPEKQYDQSRIEGYNGATGGNANKGMDPQSVENRSVENKTDWKANFTALGLRVPRSLSNDPTSPTRQLLRQMRGLARGGKGELKGSDIITLMGKLGVDPLTTRMAVGDMLLDGVLLSDVDVTERGRQMAKMRDSRTLGDTNPSPLKGAGEELEVAEFRKGTYRLRDELKPKKGSDAPTKTEAERQEDYMAVTYNDYLEFIQSAFLQKSTNALHDTFCKGGLTVYDRTGTEIGKVYGDTNMFNANSAVGVAHSGATSQMSRDAILSIMDTGGDKGNTVQAIVDRFPTQVRADVYDSKGQVKSAGVKMPIEDWHNSNYEGSLKTQAFEKLFPQMNWGFTQKLVPGATVELGSFFSAPPPHRPF